MTYFPRVERKTLINLARLMPHVGQLVITSKEKRNVTVSGVRLSVRLSVASEYST